MTESDPDRKSFESELIAIASAGIYLEALFYFEGVERFGAKEYNDKHDRRRYIHKLSLVGF